MRGPWISRFAMLFIMVAVLAALTILFKQPQVEIKTKGANPGDQMSGDVVEVTTFDLEGEPLNTIRARRGRQSDDFNWSLTDLEASIQTEDGRLVKFSADFLEEKEKTKFLSSNLGSRIYLEEQDGLKLETPGPIRMEDDVRIFSQADSQWSMGDLHGHASALDYFPAKSLKLPGQLHVNFVDMKFLGRDLNINIAEKAGEIVDAKFTQNSLVHNLMHP